MSFEASRSASFAIISTAAHDNPPVKQKAEKYQVEKCKSKPQKQSCTRLKSLRIGIRSVLFNKAFTIVT